MLESLSALRKSARARKRNREERSWGNLRGDATRVERSLVFNILGVTPRRRTIPGSEPLNKSDTPGCSPGDGK